MAGRDSGLGIRGSGQKTRFWGLGAGSWGAGLILMAALAGLAAHANEPFDGMPESRFRLRLRVFDYSGIGARTLLAASKEAAAVLEKAGFATDWHICEAAHGQMAELCNQPLQLGEVAIRILRRPKPRNGALGCTECGAAVENAEGLGSYATLYVDCLDTMPSVDGLLPSAMLGHLLAHEIGHLLLRGKDHADQGIMRPQMREEDWKLAAVGALVFTPRQAALLRAEVASRLGLGQVPRTAGVAAKP